MIDEKTRMMLAADLPRDVVRKLDTGSRADYVPSHYVIERLNAVCGHDGWSIEYGAPMLREGPRLIVHVPATLTVFGTVRRSDVGVGLAAGDKGESIETAIKAAYTDALKRCARTLGPSFGLALYDKTRATVGYSTVTLALLDEIEQCDDLTAWWASAKSRFEKLQDDEKDVVKGAVAGRRIELQKAPATVVVQPAQQPPAPEPQQPTPAAPVAATRPSPARAQLV